MSYDLVVMGASWGGVGALCSIVRSLPADFPAAVAIAQHRSSDRSQLLGSLTRCGELGSSQAEHGEPLEPGHVYVAPADYHLLIDGNRCSLSVDEQVQYSRPSIDVLFESAADSFAERLVAVILTGANSDGAAGVMRVRGQGGITIAQDPATAERREMPAAAIATGSVHRVLPLDKIPGLLIDLCMPHARATGTGR